MPASPAPCGPDSNHRCKVRQSIGLFEFDYIGLPFHGAGATPRHRYHFHRHPGRGHLTNMSMSMRIWCQSNTALRTEPRWADYTRAIESHLNEVKRPSSEVRVEGVPRMEKNVIG